MRMLETPEMQCDSVTGSAELCAENAASSWPERRTDALRMGVLVDVTPPGLRRNLHWNFAGQVAITDTLQHALLRSTRDRDGAAFDPIRSVLNCAGEALDELIEDFDLCDMPTPLRDAFIISFAAEPPLDRFLPTDRLTLLLEPGEREEAVVTIGIETDFAVDEAQVPARGPRR